MDPLLRSLREDIRALEDQKCKLCEGMGMRVVEGDNGQRFATPCECTFPLKALRALDRANLPRRFESCTFESFSTKHLGCDVSVRDALFRARRFSEEWHSDIEKVGLLFTGPAGTGKTHLAIAVLRSLIGANSGIKGLFYDHRSLLQAIKSTYDNRSAQSEYEVLTPVLRAEVLVLDELGREKRSDWAFEMIEHILTSRYNEGLTTIITTNFPNRPPAPFHHPKNAKQESEEATREQTLGDRIGDRLFSRVQQMCHIVPTAGVDFRQSVARAANYSI